MMSLIPPWEIKREILIRFEATSDEKYGKKPEERSIEELLSLGIINLDKPRGPTSHDVTATIKKVLERKHIGQGGTLEK